jgi:hypothetical protein
MLERLALAGRLKVDIVDNYLYTPKDSHPRRIGF